MDYSFKNVASKQQWQELGSYCFGSIKKKHQPVNDNIHSGKWAPSSAVNNQVIKCKKYLTRGKDHNRLGIQYTCKYTID